MNKYEQALVSAVKQITKSDAAHAASDARWLLGMVMDAAPQVIGQSEYKMFTSLLSCNGNRILAEAAKKPSYSRDADVEHLVRRLKSEYFMEEDAARRICALYLAGVTGNDAFVTADDCRRTKRQTPPGGQTPANPPRQRPQTRPRSQPQQRPAPSPAPAQPAPKPTPAPKPSPAPAPAQQNPAPAKKPGKNKAIIWAGLALLCVLVYIVVFGSAITTANYDDSSSSGSTSGSSYTSSANTSGTANASASTGSDYDRLQNMARSFAANSDAGKCSYTAGGGLAEGVGFVYTEVIGGVKFADSDGSGANWSDYYTDMSTGAVTSEGEYNRRIRCKADGREFTAEYYSDTRDAYNMRRYLTLYFPGSSGPLDKSGTLYKSIVPNCVRDLVGQSESSVRASIGLSDSLLQYLRYGDYYPDRGMSYNGPVYVGYLEGIQSGVYTLEFCAPVNNQYGDQVGVYVTITFINGRADVYVSYYY